MTQSEIETVVRRELGAVAPGTDLSALDPDADLAETLDIDSMDFLNFVIALHGALKLDIPEADYTKLRSLGSARRYLAARLGAS